MYRFTIIQNILLMVRSNSKYSISQEKVFSNIPKKKVF